MSPAAVTPAAGTPPARPAEVVATPRRAAARRAKRRADPRTRHESRVNVGLWIPTTAIFVLLAPFALVLTPFLYLAPRHMRPDPFRTMLTLGTLLLALTGTVVEVDTPDARVSLRFF